MRALIKRPLVGLSIALLMTNAHAQDAAPAATAAVVDDVVLTKDPFEGFNRGVYQFNDGWDQVLFRPIVKGYTKIVPSGSRNCIHGFFENLTVPYTALNNVLQGKFKSAGQDMCRFVVNTTVGVGGCIDVASKWNIPKHKEDFGQTLGKWGVPSGPFINLPFLGPSTVRDAGAKVADLYADPVGYLRIIKLRNTLAAAQLVDKRADLQEAMDMIDDTAIDRYALLRDVWLQLRESQVRDENYMPEGVPLTKLEPIAKTTEVAVAAPAAPMAIENTATVAQLDPLAEAELQAKKINATSADASK